MGNCNARSKTYGSAENNLSGLESTDAFNTIVHEGPILGLTYSPDGEKIISCSDDQRIAITNTESLKSSSGSASSYLVGHNKAVNRVICSGDKVYSCSRDLSVKMVRRTFAAEYSCLYHQLQFHVILSNISLLFFVKTMIGAASVGRFHPTLHYGHP